MQIHVSNLHGSLIESDIRRLFSKYGEVETVQLIRDKRNNRSRGRGYVTMPVHREALLAVAGLHEMGVNGKKIQVASVVYDPAPHSSWNVSKVI